MKRSHAAAALAVAACLALLLQSAQKPDVLAPTVFAIRDARVVTEPGKELEKATVVVRDGIITDVGADVRPPLDAIVLDGKGLTVYPGFIDGLGHWGFDPALKRSEGGPPASVDLASSPLAATKADNRKGITPEFQVSAALRAEESQAEHWRKAGFSAHLVAPEGGFFAGQSALVSLSAAVPREAVLRAPVAQHLSFRAPGGQDYPRSLMGHVAHCRQFLLDAGYHERSLKEFEAGNRLKRPPHDPALAEMAPSQGLPVVIEADSRDEIHRALDFAAEFKLRPIIYGGRDAWRAADRLAKEKVPVLLRIAFTEPDKERETPLPSRVKEDRKRKDREEQANAAVLKQKGVAFAFCTQGQTGDKPGEQFRANLAKAVEAGLSPEDALHALTVAPAKILGVERQLGTIAKGKAAHLVVMNGPFHEKDSQVRYLFADGVRFEYEVKPGKAKDKEPATKKEDPPKVEAPAKGEVATELESDRKPKTKTGGNVLLRGATLLTVTGGTKVKTDLLVRDGKIAAIGENIDLPRGMTMIDATGLYIMPGIVDTHCHFSISGGVNEFSLSVVPEVRVRDVVNGDDVQIYRALGGGVTTCRLLHGSANVVGGQDAVIKLKYGEPASALVLHDAPRGVKFALGENVKRTDGRFPNTRLGVEAVLVRAFTEAQEYRKAWQDYEARKKAGKDAGPEPRRDLRLEALADVLAGDIKVHCHCYRADEILMLLRTANKFGVKVKSLQHVLEGYKIAPEIAEHGASCSTFADWWAYKIEAFDAIPYNMALLQQAGAQVCLKSDSHELMRHLYQEAAKCIKYGGMTEEQALRTITLTPAQQLGLEKRIGSLEVGKDADLAVFNGHPLNGYSRVEMTLVEGEVYFQRSEKLTPVAHAQAGPTTPAQKPNLNIERSPNGTYVIRNVTIHTVTGKTLEKSSVVVKDGKIAAVAPQPRFYGSTAVEIDGKGLHLYPGMIDAGTILGLTELGSAKETQDYAEGGDFQPDLRASTAINPDSELIPVTRANGVLTVVTQPLGSLVAGQSAIINLNGWVPRDLIVRDPLALHIDFPAPMPGFLTDPSIPSVGRALAKKQREEKIRRLKELFAQAKAHDEARKANKDTPANPRLEAVVPYLRGEKPVIIKANRETEIREALKLAEDLKLKVILSGAIDAWKVADELKKRDVPVIIGPTMSMPSEAHDPYDAPYACAAKLHEAGVRYCIRSTGSTNSRNLPYEAAMAVAYGLPPEEGLRAVTLYPAQILGVERELGSIEAGKRANLVLTNGDLLQPSTQVVGLFIDGRPVSTASKHTRLWERYGERLREVKEGKASLGTRD